jgi:hypothetical protein
MQRPSQRQLTSTGEPKRAYWRDLSPNAANWERMVGNPEFNT